MFSEAAVVFPVVIAVVMTVVYILINLYLDASIAARDHLALRRETGIRTETVIRDSEYRGISPEDRFGRRPFTEDVDFVERKTFPDDLLENDGGRVYIIDERSHIRKVDLIKGIGKGT